MLADAVAWDYPEAAFDFVVGIFIQFADPVQRARIFAGMARALRPGGHLIVQGYTPKQLEYRTGGPSAVENLYTAELLRKALPHATLALSNPSWENHRALFEAATTDACLDLLDAAGLRAPVLESLLAVLALCVAGAAAAADGTPAAGTPFQIFSRGVAGFFEMFGVPVYVATVFMTMCVSALALTSLDAVARIGRMSFQELFSVDDMEHAEGWRKLFCNTYFSTIITLAFGFLLTQVGYANIWPLFGSANQLLSALVLVTLCVFLKVTGRNNKMLFPPLIIMLCVTFTALVQRLIAMVKATQTAASTTIPVGETSWGVVFISNGLQLILAVLLIVLGITIVVNSFKSYAKSEKNSEKASA